jgi:hypothetical protein
LPYNIGEDEKLCRSIYSPKNVNKQGKLKANAFKPPCNTDEISVNRLNFTTANFCKALAKKGGDPDKDRNYFGFAIVFQKDVLSSDFRTAYSPITAPPDMVNYFHADIKIDYIAKKDEELPTRITKKIEDLISRAMIYKDPNSNSINWEGDDLN